MKIIKSNGSIQINFWHTEASHILRELNILVSKDSNDWYWISELRNALRDADIKEASGATDDFKFRL